MTEQEKIKKVLADAKAIAALAESERELGHEKAADNIAAQLQKLLMKHKLSMSQVIEHNPDNDEEIEKHWMRWGKHDLPDTSRRCQWTEALTQIVCKANGCAFLVATGTNCVILVGKPSNIAVCEYTLAVLVRSANKLSAKEYDRFYAQCEREGDTRRAKGYRAAFLQGFCTRIAERFDEIRVNSGPVSSRALVILDNEGAEVRRWMDEQKFGKAERIGRRRSHNRHGYNRGTEVADGMDLHGRGVSSDGSSTKKIK